MNEWRNMLVERAELSTMSRNSLINGGYYTLGDVADASDPELLRIPQLGRKSLNEIRGLLASMGHVGGLYRIQLERQLAVMKERRAKLDEDISSLERRLA